MGCIRTHIVHILPPGRWKLEFWQIISPESTDGMEPRNETSKADCCIDLVMRLRAFERPGVWRRTGMGLVVGFEAFINNNVGV